MSTINIVLPKMGESVAEATVTRWLKKPGDSVLADETVLEVATDKVDTEVPSPEAGILGEILVAENEVAQVGQPLATLITQGGGTVSQPQETQSHNELSKAVPDDIPGVVQLNIAPQAETTKPAGEALSALNSQVYSPLVRSIAAKEGISNTQLAQIKGTAADGRLTKDDLLNWLSTRDSDPKATGHPAAATPASNIQAPEQAVTKARAQTQSESPATLIQPTTTPGQYDTDEVEIIEMDRMRKLIAEHMVKSVQTSPHVTSFVQADVTNLVNWRNKVKAQFEKREQQKITFTPCFIEAVAQALKDFPLVNISIEGSQIHRKKSINIGMATALPSGNLIVPVIKQADQLNLVGLTRAVNSLANRARQSQLKPEDTQQGTFTITNVGAFGNITGTPIINQPQAAILAVGTITKQPAVLETEYGDVIAIRHIMILSLSYDHRAIDGAMGGRFLKRVADYLEAWDIDRVL